MTRPLLPAELEALERAALVGFSRAPPAVPDGLRSEGEAAPSLALVAFAAQQRRLTSLPPRLSGAPSPLALPPDPRPIVPEAIRPALRRFVRAAEQQQAPELLRAVARSLRARGWRLHPLDADLWSGLALAAGPRERALAARVGRVLADAEDEGSAETWTELPLAARASWFSRSRRDDPDRARELLAAAWPGERAEARLRLLNELRVQLGPADAPFLKTLLLDRSSKVKALAQSLLDLVPGDEAEAAARLRRVIQLKPARAGAGPRLGLARGASSEDLYAALSALRPAAALQALDLGPDALTAGDLPELPAALSQAALRGGAPEEGHRWMLLALQAGWEPAGSPWLDHLLRSPLPDRTAWLAPLWPALFPLLLSKAAEVERWLSVTGGPLPAEIWTRLRGEAAWGALLDGLKDPERASAAEGSLRRLTALLSPATARPALDDLLARGPQLAPLLRQTWTLLADLEAAP